MFVQICPELAGGFVDTLLRLGAADVQTIGEDVAEFAPQLFGGASGQRMD